MSMDDSHQLILQEHRIDLALVEGNTRQPNLKYTPFPYNDWQIA